MRTISQRQLRNTISAVLNAVETGTTYRITRNGVAVAELRPARTGAADLHDLALVLTRATVDTGRRTSFDDVLAAFGHTRESLAALPDDD